MSQLSNNIFIRLKDYIKNHIDNDWSNFRDEIIEEVFDHSGQDKIDIESHTASRWNWETEETDVYKFETQVRRKISEELQTVLSKIEANFQKLYIENDSGVKGYAKYLKVDYQTVQNLSNYQKYKFLPKLLREIPQTINQYSQNNGVKKSLSDTSFSFVLLPNKNAKVQKEKIEKLYDLLKKRKIINSTKREFTKGFTGKKVEKGLSWLVTGKNRQVSKRSLFYFIENLQKQKHLDFMPFENISKYIEYTFRGIKGEILKNMKQSKTSTGESSKVSRQDDLDDIISSL